MTEQNNKIRMALLEDADVIFNFISHLEERVFDADRFNERFSENLKNPDVIYLVAVNEQGDVIGFISSHGQSVLHHEGKIFGIQELYVARNFRDRGIGKALVAALEEKGMQFGCESLEVTTHVKRAEAKKFYLKTGFVQTHVKFVKEM